MKTLPCPPPLASRSVAAGDGKGGGAWVCRETVAVVTDGARVPAVNLAPRALTLSLGPEGQGEEI